MKPYDPQPLPIRDLDLSRLITPVGEANAALAEYNGLLQAMVNPTLMLSPLTNQEAVLSSKIEGSQATVEDVLQHEAGQDFDERKTTDIREVLNYRQALVLASDHIEGGRPINLSLILHLHSILMDSVRGQNKSPGEFRKDQNWIGPWKCPIEEATFIPPAPLQLPNHLEAWQQYMASDDFDPLMQTAIVHAQFELLHPFRDGNGRIGRLLIPLFLFAKRRLSSPMFYLSAYLEANRDEYYARLGAISAEQDWTSWIEFFLRGTIHQASVNRQRLILIMALYDRSQEQVQQLTHSQHAAKLVDALFAHPIFRASDLQQRTGIVGATLQGLLRQLGQAGGPLIVLRPRSGRSPAVYAFPDLLKFCDGPLK